SYLTDNTIITGSFGPTGINSYPAIEHQLPTINLTFNSIQIKNNTNNSYTYQITDITGRVVKHIEAKKGITQYTPDKSGIYFILDNKNRVMGKSIIVR
ncbi:MAG: T9SS type A sorting domain-containing protein, partial [bacterium]